MKVEIKQTAECISSVEHARFTSVYLSALYAFTPQGRSQAFEKITYTDFVNAFNQGSSPCSTEFKTQMQYKHQFITLSGDVVQTLTSDYINVIRPLVAKHRASQGFVGWRKGNFLCFSLNLARLIYLL